MENPLLYVILNQEFTSIPIFDGISFNGEAANRDVDFHLVDGLATSSSGRIYKKYDEWIFECIDGTIVVDEELCKAGGKAILKAVSVLFLCDSVGNPIRSKFIVFQSKPTNNWRMIERQSYDLSTASEIDCLFIDNHLVIYLYNQVIFLDQHSEITGKTSPNQHVHTPNLQVAIQEVSVGKMLNKKVLLKDIYLEIATGEMVLILGGSGAGKTTFMEAVTGLVPSQTSVNYNGVDLLKSPERHRMLTLSPQLPEEHYRMEDTVYRNLDDAARLFGSLELENPIRRKEEVTSILGKLDLESVKDSKCSSLSGGQKKKLTIAMEYINQPDILFMDEPDSGVDGSMVMEIMSSLRKIADEGKILCVITHTPDRIRHLFDKVIVIGKSSENCGRLCYYGAIDAALETFSASSLEEIVHKISGDENKVHVDQYVQQFEIERMRS